MKTLYFFVLVHSPEETGSIKKYVPPVELGRLELQTSKAIELIKELEQKMISIQTSEGIRIYNAVSEFVSTADFDALYLDSFPAYMEAKIIKRAKEIGGQFANLIVIAEKRNKRIVGCESLRWLKNFLNFFTKQAANVPASAVPIIITSLARKRDRFIAAHIKRTLKDGETGVLIMGAAHDPTRYLSEDFVIIKPNLGEQDWIIEMIKSIQIDMTVKAMIYGCRNPLSALSKLRTLYHKVYDQIREGEMFDV